MASLPILKRFVQIGGDLRILFFLLFCAVDCFSQVFVDAPTCPTHDRVRNPKTGELYVVQVRSVFIDRENHPDSTLRGFGFSAKASYLLTPELDRVRVDGWTVKSCPDGWLEVPTHRGGKTGFLCNLPVSLSPPLSFVLDTGENRLRIIPKAERDSVFNRFNVSSGYYSAGSEYSYGVRRVVGFVYLDKVGNSHPVTFRRWCTGDRDRFVSELYYPLDSGKCDKGWTRIEGRCYYTIPDPALFSPKKKPTKKSKRRPRNKP